MGLGYPSTWWFDKTPGRAVPEVSAQGPLPEQVVRQIQLEKGWGEGREGSSPTQPWVLWAALRDGQLIQPISRAAFTSSLLWVVHVVDRVLPAASGPPVMVRAGPHLLGCPPTAPEETGEPLLCPGVPKAAPAFLIPSPHMGPTGTQHPASWTHALPGPDPGQCSSARASPHEGAAGGGQQPAMDPSSVRDRNTGCPQES